MKQREEKTQIKGEDRDKGTKKAENTYEDKDKIKMKAR